MPLRFCPYPYDPRVCFDIPVLYPLHPLGHGPWPPPEDWIRLEGETPDWAVDLQALSAVNALAARARPALQERLQAVVAEAAETIRAELPEGAELHVVAEA